MSHSKKYPKAMILIHWLTVLLVAFVFYKGTTLEHLEFTETNMNTFRSHAVPGMLILILTIIRLLIRRKNKLPKEIEYYSPMHKIMVETANKLIYTLLILVPIVGFVMVYKTGALSYDLGGAFPEGAKFNETLATVHKILVFSLMGLIILHVSGVIIYKIKKGENLIKRMCHLIK